MITCIQIGQYVRMAKLNRLYSVQLQQASMRKSQSAQTKNKGRRKREQLVTEVEANLYSQGSQWGAASGFTQRTQRQGTAYTGGTSAREFDDYEDLIDDVSSVFISGEEEVAIRAILQLGRKGKINPGNAFEVPLRVINPQATSSINVRFWKFASELLQTSMNIYDKRVDNVYVGINKMVGDLTRIKAHPSQNQQLQEEEHEQKSKKKRQQILSIDIEHLGSAESISSYQLKHIHTEQPKKLNIKPQAVFMLQDPLFQKRLKLFDSNRLDSLLMNTFQCGSNLQIVFFGQIGGKNKRKLSEQYIQIVSQKKKVAIDVQSQSVVLIDESGNCSNQSVALIDENAQINKEEEAIMLYIGDQYKKLSFIARNYCMFQNFERFRAVYIGTDHIDANTIQFSGVAEDLKILMEDGDIRGRDTEDAETVLDMSQGVHNINHNPYSSNWSAEGNRWMSENTNRFSQRELSCQLPFSQKMYNKSLLQADECATLAVPWELEFRGSKLVRKRNNLNKQKRRRNKDEKQRQYIDFTVNLEEEMQTRQKILLSKDSNNQDYFSEISYSQRYIMPKSMNPFAQILRLKKQKTLPIGQHLSHTLSQTNLHPVLPDSQNYLSIRRNDPLYYHQGPLKESQKIEFTQDNQREPGQQSQTGQLSMMMRNMPSQEIRNMKTFGLKSIRQIKEYIYDQLLRKKRIALIDLDVNLSPAQLFIVFLYVANEKNLEVHGTDDQSNVYLAIPN